MNCGLTALWSAVPPRVFGVVTSVAGPSDALISTATADGLSSRKGGLGLDWTLRAKIAVPIRRFGSYVA